MARHADENEKRPKNSVKERKEERNKKRRRKTRFTVMYDKNKEEGSRKKIKLFYNLELEQQTVFNVPPSSNWYICIGPLSPYRPVSPAYNT
jgi:hypothetical protein